MGNTINNKEIKIGIYFKVRKDCDTNFTGWWHNDHRYLALFKVLDIYPIDGDTEVSMSCSLCSKSSLVNLKNITKIFTIANKVITIKKVDL